MNAERHSSAKAAGFLVPAVILLLLGITGVILYATGAPDAGGAEGSSLGGMRGGLVIGSALCMGVGAVLLVLGIIRLRRGSRPGLTDTMPPPPPPDA